MMLACILALPVNFLVLDEPTNHLDIASRGVLLEALLAFDGTLMIVSHDRWFLRHLTNRVFEIDHGALRVYEGGYGEYILAGLYQVDVVQILAGAVPVAALALLVELGLGWMQRWITPAGLRVQTQEAQPR